MRWGVLAVGCWLLCCGLSCSTGSAKPSVNTAPPQAADAGVPSAGKVRLQCEPPHAEIVVDGKPAGTAETIERQGGLEVPFGLHRFEIRLEGFKTFRLELNVGEKPEVIRVKLSPRAGDKQ